MRVVSIGDLVTDYYYNDKELLGIDGGQTSHNIIANLSKMGINTTVFGGCGNDDCGIVAIKSLEEIGVDINNIKITDNIKTHSFHVSFLDDIISKKRCPYCNDKSWYKDSLIECKNILLNLDKDDILVFDNLNYKNQIIIDNTINKKIIDLGQYYEFDNMTNEKIIKILKNKFDIINFNERVTNYLINRFNLVDELDIYKLIRPRLMTVTRGSKGASFIYDNKCYDFILENKATEIDPTGAGDAFVASIIKDWLDNNMEIDENKLKFWYNNSCELTSRVVSKIGARGHIKSLYKIKKIDNYCTCNKFELL